MASRYGRPKPPWVGAPGFGTGSWWALGAVFVLLALVLWWFFREVDFAEVVEHLAGANPLWLTASSVVALAGFCARAARWRYLLAPIQPRSSFRPRFAAVAVGFAGNNLLPSGRLGEPARAFAYSRSEPVGFPAALATLVVERLMDGGVVFLLLLATLYSPSVPAGPLPAELATAARGTAAVLAVALVVSLAVLARPAQSGRVVEVASSRLPIGRLGPALSGFVAGVAEGLSSMRGWRLMLPALAWSLCVWLVQALSFWLGFVAFDLELPLTAALLTTVATALAAAIPAAPGYIGTLQAAVTIALVQVFGAEPEAILAFAVGWHAVTLPPITLIGLWHARRLGVSLVRPDGSRGEGDSVGEGSGGA